MPSWTTPTPQPQRPFSSPSTIRHLCLHSIVTFVIRANVEWLTYLSICLQTTFFIGRTWLRRCSSERERIPWGQQQGHRQRCGVVIELCYVIYLCHKTMAMYYCEDYMDYHWFICLELELLLFCYLNLLYVSCFGSSPSREAAKTGLIEKKSNIFSINWGTYDLMFFS
jgi:hypothetical protein